MNPAYIFKQLHSIVNALLLLFQLLRAAAAATHGTTFMAESCLAALESASCFVFDIFCFSKRMSCMSRLHLGFHFLAP